MSTSPSVSVTEVPVSVASQLRKSLGKSLIIPCLLLVFFACAPSWLNYRLHGNVNDDINQDQTLSSDEKTARVEAFSKIDFEEVCHSTGSERPKLRQQLEQSGVSGRFARLAWGFRISVALMAVLLATVGAVWVLNRRARRSGEDLIRSYRLGWRLAMAAALTKLLLLTPLLAYGLYEFTVLAVDRYYPQAIFMIVLGGVLMVWASARLLLKRVPLEFAEPLSREILPGDAPELWRTVTDAAARLGTAAPDHILVGMQLNFYVTELAVKPAAGRVEGRTLFLSQPLMKQLSPEEIVAIIGHELGHFVGEDTKITREFYPLRFKAQATLLALAKSGWVGWPSMNVLNFFSWCFGSTEQAMSRERELLADRTGAGLTSYATMAQALVKFHVVNEAVKMEIIGAGGERPENPYDAPLGAFIREKLVPKTAFWAQLFEKKTPHPFDSHPALHVRLESLGQTITPEDAMELATASVTNAFDRWFPEAEALFGDLTKRALEVVGQIRARADLVAADASSEQGRLLLEKHFPERRWRVRAFSVWLLVLVWLSIVVGFLIGAVVADGWLVKTILGAVGVSGGVMGAISWHGYRKRELVLNADGLIYTNWRRPLAFANVRTMQATNVNGSMSITFKLKTSEPPIAKGGSLLRRQKAVTLPIHMLNEKQAEVLQVIHRYYTRQIAE